MVHGACCWYDTFGRLLKDYRAKLTNIRTWRRLGSGLVTGSRVLSRQGHGMLGVASHSDNPRQLEARSVVEPCQHFLYIYIFFRGKHSDV